MTTKAKSRRKPASTVSPAEGRLFDLFAELVEDKDILSFVDHARIPITMGLASDKWWPAFRAHYTGPDGIDESQVAMDLATWGPIASRVVELQLAQQRGSA